MLKRIREITQTDAFRDYLRDLLLELCAVDTTPNADVSKSAAAEGQCLAILERELAKLPWADAVAERHGIDPAIARHPAFSQLHYTKTPECPKGLAVEDAYRDRANLVWQLPGDGPGLALNAHLDVVKPFIPPRVEDGILYGRGSCDDKGPVVAIVGALKVLAELGVRPAKDLVGMFVIEEETGGNGSLSLALDRELKGHYESILVLECADGDVYPANRGAVWYEALVAQPGVPPLELAAFVIAEFEAEGRALRTESAHPLFPQRPVQTCHGIIGRFGEHPSRICGHVAFHVVTEVNAATRQLVGDCLEVGLAEYVGLYGDKTRVADPQTGRPKVDHHYDLAEEPGGFRVDVYGATGHMGSILENDGAITKMAAMLRHLVYSKAALARAGGGVAFELDGAEGAAELTLEGGQGFVPIHPIAEVMDRVRRAAWRGAERYLDRVGHPARGRMAVRVTFDKLHNDAFDGDPDSLPMRTAVAAARDCGLRDDHPVIGWTVSCDARLFAGEYPDMPVLTTGPGYLHHAHADAEQMDLEALRAAVDLVALYIIRLLATK